MLLINNKHKEAIIKLINSIISQTPLIHNLNNRTKVNQKLVKLIHFFEHSIDSANNKSNKKMEMNVHSSEALIENWLLHYYFGDSVMNSFAIEDGVEQELSTASLLILYVINKVCDCFPHIKMYFNENWVHLQEFNSRLDEMLRNDKLIHLISHGLSQTNNYNNFTNYYFEQNIKSDDLNRFQIESESEMQSTNSATDQLSAISFANSKPNTYHNNDMLCLSSNEEVIVPQLLNCELSMPSVSHTSLLDNSLTQRFVCNECKLCFVTKYKLTRHQYVHKPHSKPLKCTWIGCERRFRSRYDRNRHHVTHTGERPFLCDYPQCDKRFSRADKLKIHSKKHFN